MLLLDWGLWWCLHQITWLSGFIHRYLIDWGLIMRKDTHLMDLSVLSLTDFLVTRLFRPYLWLYYRFSFFLYYLKFPIVNLNMRRNWIATFWALIWLLGLGFSFGMCLWWDIIQEVILLALNEDRLLLGDFLGCGLFFCTGFGWFFGWFLSDCGWFSLGCSGQCYGANFILLCLLSFAWCCLCQLFQGMSLYSWRMDMIEITLLPGLIFCSSINLRRLQYLDLLGLLLNDWVLLLCNQYLGGRQNCWYGTVNDLLLNLLLECFAIGLG